MRKKGAVKLSELTMFLVLGGLILTLFVSVISQGQEAYNTDLSPEFNASYSNITKHVDDFRATIETGLIDEVRGEKEGGIISKTIDLVDKAFTATVGAIQLVTGSFTLVTAVIGEFARQLGIPRFVQVSVLALALIGIAWGIISAWRGYDL